MKKICVVWMGYMWIPTASLFANNWHKVIWVDVIESKVNDINNWIVPFSEPWLSDELKKAINSWNMIAKLTPENSDVFIIAVPTPHNNNRCDHKYIISAIESIAKYLEDWNLVIIESTISPNTCKNIVKNILDKTWKKYLLAHCPERAIPGNTMNEIINNDRIIWWLTKEAEEKTKKLYKSFVKWNIFTTDITTAEVCKLLENTYRDINIALANQVLMLSDELWFNPWKAIELANKHPRVNILNPWPWVWGHCIAIDPWFLTQDTKNNSLISTARKINDTTPFWWVKKIITSSKKLNLNKITVWILWIAYKKDVDDARETPAYYIWSELINKWIKVLFTDPYVKDFNYTISDIEETLKSSDIIFINTDHSIYKKIDFSQYKNIKKIIDSRNFLNK